jgi:uncharacterized protein with NRDE domain
MTEHCYDSAMCLLVVGSRVVPGFPLVIGANRDERLDRPAISMTVLQETSPVILGGRDEQAGGTWLAVNEHGVVAGLTNRPAPAGRDLKRRSRGELPLLLAAEPSANAAVEAFFARAEPSSYNAAWLLVGDRRSVSYIELDGATVPRCQSLPGGIYVLENRPLGAQSGKVDRARELLGDPSTLPEDQLIERLIAVLSDHEVGPEPDPDRPSARGAAKSIRRPACVHGATYATRSSTIVLVPDDATPILVLVADGRPCSTPFTNETSRWPTATVQS